MKVKHLVLDNDVHERLKARKRETGLTVKEIGNTALRAFLLREAREERIVEELVKSGLITREDYEQAAAQAAEELRSGYLSIRDLARVDADGSLRGFVRGGWAGREVARCPKGSWQIIEAWARDGRRELTPSHTYPGVQAYGVLLSGKILLVCGSETTVLAAPQVFQFASGHTCASAPIGKKTHLLMILSPAVWDHNAPSREEPSGG